MFIRINSALGASLARRKENEKGFTLIELLVVVLIIGVLAAIAIPMFLGQQKQAKLSSVEQDLSSVKSALMATMVNPPAAWAFPTGAISDASIPGFSKSNDVTLTMTGDADGFCIDGAHTEYTTAADGRHVRDTGGVKAGTCAAPTTP